MTNNKGYLVNKDNEKLFPDQYDSGWIYPTLENGWNNSSAHASPVRYRKIGNVVYIAGSITGGTFRSTIFTLPVGFRPGGNYQVTLIRATAGYARLHINYDGKNNGRVILENVDGTNEEVSLFNISFIAEY